MSPDRRWANREVSRETDQHQARGLWLRSLLLIAALLPGGVWLWQQSRCVQLTYEVQRMRERHDELLEQERRLLAERESAGSLDRIERWAQRRRSLVRPDEGRIVVLRPAAGQPTEDLLARSRE